MNWPWLCSTTIDRLDIFHIESLNCIDKVYVKNYLYNESIKDAETNQRFWIQTENL